MCNESCIHITKAEPSRKLSHTVNLKVKSGAGNPGSILIYMTFVLSQITLSTMAIIVVQKYLSGGERSLLLLENWFSSKSSKNILINVRAMNLTGGPLGG